jgi:hypothetical protein
LKRPVGEQQAGPVTRHPVEQRRITYRGREFHFVSYDGLPANEKRSQAATAAAWWLMGAGTRWEVLPFRPGQPAQELDRQLTEWIETHVFGTTAQGA